MYVDPILSHFFRKNNLEYDAGPVEFSQKKEAFKKYP